LRVNDYLDHIVQAIERIERYTLGKGQAAFLQDEQLQDAVIRNIEILGEAANNIKKADPLLTDHHPEVPWLVMVAMRNRVSHAYFSVDQEIVWATIRNDLPVMKQQILALIKGLQGKSGAGI
jgi:uncharacterized protein with HEPN domain